MWVFVTVKRTLRSLWIHAAIRTDPRNERETARSMRVNPHARFAAFRAASVDRKM